LLAQRLSVLIAKYSFHSPEVSHFLALHGRPCVSPISTDGLQGAKCGTFSLLP
jgi:hypothetical protein